MPRFIYKAKSGPGAAVEGEFDADSPADAVARLDRMGYSPVWVREKDAGGESGEAARPRTGRISRRDVTVFTRQLASLTKSGVPILRALSTIANQTESAGFRRVISDIEKTIRDGSMLSGAMSKYPAVFSDVYLSMVRSGESAGVLDTILFRLAEMREKEEETRRKVQAATAYPALIVIVGIITVFVLLAFFLPRVTALFKDQRNLPWPTKVLMGSSDFVADHWYWIVMIALLIAAVFNRLASMEKGRTFVDGMKLRIPLIGRFMLQADIARFARTLSLLIEAGVSIDKSLILSADTLGNSVLREEIRKIGKETILQGAPFSTGLKKSRHFPVLVTNMIAVGEESGRLDESLAEVASFYERDVEQQSRLATALIEPILILVVGAIVGFIVAAMLLPIFQLSSTL